MSPFHWSNHQRTSPTLRPRFVFSHHNWVCFQNVQNVCSQFRESKLVVGSTAFVDLISLGAVSCTLLGLWLVPFLYHLGYGGNMWCECGISVKNVMILFRVSVCDSVSGFLTASTDPMNWTHLVQTFAFGLGGLPDYLFNFLPPLLRGTFFRFFLLHITTSIFLFLFLFFFYFVWLYFYLFFKISLFLKRMTC